MSNLGLNYFSNATIGRLQIGGSNQVLDLQTTSQLTINEQNRNDVLYQLIQDISGGGGGGGGTAFQDLSGVVYDLSADILTLTNEIADLSNNQTTTLTYDALQDRYTLEANANLLNGKDAIISIAYGDFNEIFVNGVYNKNGSDTMEIFGSIGETLLSLAKSAFGASKYVKYAKIGGSIAGGLILGSVVASSVADLVGAFDTPPDTIESTLLFGNGLLGRLIYSSYDLYDTSLNLPLSNNNAIWNYVVCEDSHSDFYTLKLKDYANALDFSNNANKRPTQLQNSVKITGDNRLYSIGGIPHFNNHPLISQDGTQIRISNSTLTGVGLEAYNNELYWNNVIIGSTNGDWRHNATSGNIYSNVGVEINTNGGLSNQTHDCLSVFGGNINDKYISRFTNTRLYLQSSSSWGSNDIGGIQLDNLRPADYTSVKTIYRYNDNLYWGTEQLNNQVNKYINVSGTTTLPSTNEVTSAYVVYTDNDAKARLCLMTDQDGGSRNSALITKTFGGALSFTNQSGQETTDLDHLTISTTGAVAIDRTLTIYNNGNQTTSFQLVGGGIQLQKELYNCLISNDANGITTFTGNAGNPARTFYLNTRGTGYNSNLFSFGEALGTHSQAFTVAGTSYFGGTLSSTSINNSGSIFTASTYSDYDIVKTELQMYNVDASIGSLSKTDDGTNWYLSLGKQSTPAKSINVISKTHTGAIDYAGQVGIRIAPKTANALTIRQNNATNMLTFEYSDTVATDFKITSNNYLDIVNKGIFLRDKANGNTCFGVNPVLTTDISLYINPTSNDNLNSYASLEINPSSTRLYLRTHTGSSSSKAYELKNSGSNVISSLIDSGMSYKLSRNSGSSVVERYILDGDHTFKDDTGAQLMKLSSTNGRMDVGSSSAYVSTKHDGTNGVIGCNTGTLYLQQAGTNLVSLNATGSLMTVPRIQIYGNKANDTTYITDFGFGGGYGIYLNSQQIGANAANKSGMVWVTLRCAGDEYGNIVCNGSGTTYNTTSDYRLKFDIEDMNEVEAVERMSKLRTRQYRWHRKPDRVQRGFIAHELQEDGFKLAVSGYKDEVDASGNPVYQGVDYGLLVADLCCVSKALIKKTETQNDTIDALYNELHALIETHAKANIKLHDLEIENQFLKNKIIQLEQANYTNSQFETKLTALENKVNWLLAK